MTSSCKNQDSVQTFRVYRERLTSLLCAASLAHWNLCEVGFSRHSLFQDYMGWPCCQKAGVAQVLLQLPAAGADVLSHHKCPCLARYLWQDPAQLPSL